MNILRGLRRDLRLPTERVSRGTLIPEKITV